MNPSVTDALSTDRFIRVMNRNHYELRAVIDGRNIYAQVINQYGKIQFPLWNPIDIGFSMWDDIPDRDTVTMMESCWNNLSRHPALYNMAA